MAVNLHTTHYRFGINELTESTHGWHAALDTNPAQGAIAVNTTFLLRFTVQETGGTAAGNTDSQFQCSRNGGAFQNITTTSTIVKAVTTSVFANAANLTKRLTGTGTFEASGAGGTHDGLSGGAPNDIAASGNSETECALQIVGADVSGGDAITFRLTSPDFTITNDVVPTLTVAVSAITGTGVLTAQSASVAGSGASSTVGTGSLQVNVSQVAGSGVSGSAGNGALQAGNSTATGQDETEVTGAGAVVAANALVTGSGVSESVAQGVLIAQTSTVTGSGVSVSIGDGSLVASFSTASGVGNSSSTGTGELIAQDSTASGSSAAPLKLKVWTGDTWRQIGA